MAKEKLGEKLDRGLTEFASKHPWLARHSDILRGAQQRVSGRAAVTAHPAYTTPLNVPVPSHLPRSSRQNDEETPVHPIPLVAEDDFDPFSEPEEDYSRDPFWMKEGKAEPDLFKLVVDFKLSKGEYSSLIRKIKSVQNFSLSWSDPSIAVMQCARS